MQGSPSAKVKDQRRNEPSAHEHNASFVRWMRCKWLRWVGTKHVHVLQSEGMSRFLLDLRSRFTHAYTGVANVTSMLHASAFSSLKLFFFFLSLIWLQRTALEIRAVRTRPADSSGRFDWHDRGLSCMQATDRRVHPATQPKYPSTSILKASCSIHNL
jgi:hypothetical protein